MKIKDRKQSNKGFTLVEVLVAIVILSIIVVPLLSAFVVSAKTNAKARMTLRVTTLAQNIIEELKAYSLEESAAQYNGIGNAITGESMASYETLLHVDGVHGVLKKDDEGEIQGRSDGRFDFVLKGVKQGSTKFDVEIMVRKPGFKDLSNANLQQVGELSMANIVSMNRSDCAYYAQQATEHTMIGEEYVRLRGVVEDGEEISGDEFQEIMTRTITIDIDRLVGDNATVKVTYSYEIPSGYVDESLRYQTQYSTVFDNYASGEPLQSVYLYYYPLYGISARDSFVINNPDDLDVEVFLIKMKDNEYNVFNHANYRPNVSLNETTRRDDDSSHAKICTNIIETNLNLHYNGTLTGVRVSDLGNEEIMQNLYDVTIRVYKHNEDAFDTSAEEILIDFDDKDKVATFTGTVLDKAQE